MSQIPRGGGAMRHFATGTLTRVLRERTPLARQPTD